MYAPLRVAARRGLLEVAKGIRLPAAAATRNGEQLQADVRLVSSDAGLRLIRDEHNVVSSPCSPVSGYENVYLHEMIWRDLDKWPDHVATVSAETGKAYTYRQLRKLCGRFATTLRKMKILPGDTIAVVLPNLPEYPIPVLGASEAGVKVTLLNYIYSAEEIKKQLNDSEAVAVITITSKFNEIKQSIQGNKYMRVPIIVVDDGSGPAPRDCIKFNDLVNDDVEEFHLRENTGIGFEDTALLPYSSGTTGLPKGVELTHRSVVANMFQLNHEMVCCIEETTGTYQEVVPLTLPAFHMYGLAVGIFRHLRTGGQLVCMSKFTLPHFLKVLEEHPVSLLYVVPPIIQMMCKSPEVKNHHVRALKQILSGAAPLGKETIGLFKERTGRETAIVQGYGLTELSPVTSASLAADPVSVGHLLANTDMRIVGTSGELEGRNLGPNQVGELYIRGPHVMKGYYKNPKATAESMDGDWFKTGDLGSYNDKGLIYIEGRLKELIKVKGFQVAPAELEDVLRAHEKVADVAIIGIPHEDYGEVPKAFVVPKPGATVRPEEMMDFVAQRVAKFKQLGAVQFVDNIPKSLSGKILRKDLQNMR